MFRRLFFCSCVLTPWLLCWTGEVRAQGNTYAVVRTVNYYPSAGANGTVVITYQFTGSTQQPPNMCTTPGVKHQPRVSATFTAHGQNFYQSSQGQYIGPCVNMNQSLSISFDLAASNCDLAALDNGDCTVSDEPIIFCTALMHAFGSLPWWNVQLEDAETHSVISALLKADGFHPQAPYCSIPSSPADLEPATEADPKIPAGQYVETAFMWREIPWGQTNFTGVPWHRAIPLNPEHIEPPTFEAPDCTNWDNHYRGVPPVYTP